MSSGYAHPPGMSDREYNRRQAAAEKQLKETGMRPEKWRAWLRNNLPPKEWTGTPLEWVLEEMPMPFDFVVNRAIKKIFG